MKPKKIFYFLLLIFLLILGFGFPKLTKGYLGNEIECFSQADCDDPYCGRSLKCYDDQPGCIVYCKFSDRVCPLDAACSAFAGEETQECGYEAATPRAILDANKTVIAPGQSVTLSWSVEPWHTQYCEIKTSDDITIKVVKPNYNSPSSGTLKVSPTETTTYILYCENNCYDGFFFRRVFSHHLSSM
mgnify:CR=1 FL=1